MSDFLNNFPPAVAAEKQGKTDMAVKRSLVAAAVLAQLLRRKRDLILVEVQKEAQSRGLGDKVSNHLSTTLGQGPGGLKLHRAGKSGVRLNFDNLKLCCEAIDDGVMSELLAANSMTPADFQAWVGAAPGVPA